MKFTNGGEESFDRIIFNSRMLFLKNHCRSLWVASFWEYKKHVRNSSGLSPMILSKIDPAESSRSPVDAAGGRVLWVPSECMKFTNGGEGSFDRTIVDRTIFNSRILFLKNRSVDHDSVENRPCCVVVQKL